MKDKKLIVFLINSLEGGGAERVFSNLVTYASQYWEGVTINVVILDECEEAYSIPKSVEKYTLNTSGSFVKSYFLLKQQLKLLQPDVVFSFLTRANCAAILCSGTHKTIISERVNTSSHFEDNISGFINKLLVKFLYKKANHVIAVSKGVGQDLVNNFEVDKSQVSVIYNSYDINKLNQLAAESSSLKLDNNYIVSAGRLVNNKNFEMLLNLYAKSKTTFDLAIMGDGPLKGNLLKQCEDLGVRERVHFLGFISNPYPVLSKAKLFISTSNAEGFPNALVEAMAMKLPVLATDCLSGPAEILINEINANSDVFIKGDWGYLIPTNNVDEGVNALNDMLEDNNLSAFSDKSKKRAEQFNVKETMQRYFNVINFVSTGGK